MKKETCDKHPDVELVVVKYCPACRGASGGRNSAKGMTAAERTARARKGALARYGKGKKK